MLYAIAMGQITNKFFWEAEIKISASESSDFMVLYKSVFNI